MSKQQQGTVVVGIGGGGGKIVQRAARHANLDWLQVIHMDTDVEDLDYSDGVFKLAVGEDWTRGLGAGGNVALGRNATSASAKRIGEMLGHAELLLVVACLGGGTGSGGAQVLAALAREAKVMTVVLATMPLAFEGNARRDVAEQALRSLRSHADMVIPVQNDLVFGGLPADTRFSEAMDLANGVLGEVLVAIAELRRQRLILPFDFSSLRQALRERECFCAPGIGHAATLGEAQALVADLMASPLLGGREGIRTAGALVGFLTGRNLSLTQMNACMDCLRTELGPDTKTLFGASDLGPGEGLCLVILAVHYQTSAPHEPLRHEDEPAQKAKRKAQRERRRTQQVDLPFAETQFSVGIFGNVSPTIWRGENLDVPTFQRRGVPLEEDPA